MRKALGSGIAGFVAGWWLSWMRTQPGTDLIHWTIADIDSALRMRGLALMAIGVVLSSTSVGVAWSTIAAAALGFAVHGLFFGIQGGLGAGALVLALIALSIGLLMTIGTSSKQQEDDASTQPLKSGFFGLLVAGAGVAVALESIARHVRLFGAGLSQDDSVFGATFLALTALGAVSFGWIAIKKRFVRLSFPFLLAVVAASTFLSLRLIDRIADAKGLTPFVRKWGLDSSNHGGLAWDALISAAAFVVPAFALGAALVAARGKRSLLALFFGAGVALALIPDLLGRSAETSTDSAQIFSAQLVPLATLVTIAGAAFAILAESKRGRARYVALALTVLCGAPALFTTVKPIFVMSPWAARPVFPYVAFETPEGLATVEPSKGGLKVATLDRQLLSPETADIDADVDRIRQSFALLAPTTPPRNDLKVLFVGQITPIRAAVLLDAGASVIDRSAPWSRAMSRLEGELFKAQDGKAGVAPPAGEILTPKVARERFAGGAYDLVIAMPIDGDAPPVGFLDAPAKTVVVRWLSASQPLRGVGRVESSKFDGEKVVHIEQVVLSADGFEGLTFGVMTNAHVPTIAPRRPGTATLGREIRTPRPFAWLGVRENLRGDDARDDASTRLLVACAADTKPPREGAMQAYYAAQIQSSPYETAAQRVELEDDVLDELAKMHAQTELDAFDRQLWEWIARVLLGKREVERMDRFLEPMAKKFAPWPALEIVLARADLEALDPQHAIERLTALGDVGRRSSDALSALGDAYEQLGDAANSEKARRSALAIRPADIYVERKLAIALFRAGSSEGRMKLQEILLAHPDDDEVKNLLNPGPLPIGPSPQNR